jgi:hypothetical protein
MTHTIDSGTKPALTDATWTLWHSVGLFGGMAVLVAADIWVPAYEGAFCAAVGIIAVIVAVIGHGETGVWRGVFIDPDSNKISLSRFQLVLWTVLLVSGLVAAALGNIFRHPLPCPTGQDCSDPLHIRLSAKVWLLMGISISSTITSVLLDQTNRREGRRFASLSDPASASWGDLFQAKEGSTPGVDITRVQNFFFTVILVIAYGARLYNLFAQHQFITAFPELSNGMLTLLGISHAAFLVRKGIAQ